MKTGIVVSSVVALAIGLAGGYAIAKATSAPAPEPASQAHDMQAAMSSMMASLDGKSGDAFDQAFLAEMVMHHQGAVAMAEAALQSAGHEDIKAMAREIIRAQNAEIAQMQAWQTQWYGGAEHTQH